MTQQTQTTQRRLQFLTLRKSSPRPSSPSSLISLILIRSNYIKIKTKNPLSKKTRRKKKTKRNRDTTSLRSSSSSKKTDQLALALLLRIDNSLSTAAATLRCLSSNPRNPPSANPTREAARLRTSEAMASTCTSQNTLRKTNLNPGHRYRTTRGLLSTCEARLLTRSWRQRRRKTSREAKINSPSMFLPTIITITFLSFRLLTEEILAARSCNRRCYRNRTLLFKIAPTKELILFKMFLNSLLFLIFLIKFPRIVMMHKLYLPLAMLINKISISLPSKLPILTLLELLLTNVIIGLLNTMKKLLLKCARLVTIDYLTPTAILLIHPIWTE